MGFESYANVFSRLGNYGRLVHGNLDRFADVGLYLAAIP